MIEYLNKMKELNYQDNDFFEEIKNDEFYSNNSKEGGQSDKEKNRRECIFESYRELLDIIKYLYNCNEVDNYNELDNFYYNELTNLIYSYINKLTLAAHSVYRWVHLGQCYAPDTSRTYLKLKNEVNFYLTPIKFGGIKGYHGVIYDDYTF